MRFNAREKGENTARGQNKFVSVRGLPLWEFKAHIKTLKPHLPDRLSTSLPLGFQTVLIIACRVIAGSQGHDNRHFPSLHSSSSNSLVCIEISFYNRDCFLRRGPFSTASICPKTNQYSLVGMFLGRK